MLMMHISKLGITHHRGHVNRRTAGEHRSNLLTEQCVLEYVDEWIYTNVHEQQNNGSVMKIAVYGERVAEIKGQENELIHRIASQASDYHIYQGLVDVTQSVPTSLRLLTRGISGTWRKNC